MKVLIVEDETAASENLIAMLQELDSEIEVLKVLESVQQTVRWLSSSPAPDLIFMDIHLSDGSAFTLFQEIDVKSPVVFTTAYDQYALDAFAVNSIDYLLKPIKATELARALDKFKRWSGNDLVGYLQRMVNMASERPRQSGAYVSSLLVPLHDKLLPVSLSDVVCIYNTGRKTLIYLKDGRNMAYNKSLDSIISILDPARFYRANKQYIVSRDCINGVIQKFG